MGRMAAPWLFEEYDIALWRYAGNMTLFAFFCGVLGMGIIQSTVPKKVQDAWRFSAVECVYCALLLAACIGALASDTYNPFIYFQF